MDSCFSAYDLKRLESYANNMLDYHVITDMLPTIAQHVFTERLAKVVTMTTTSGSGADDDKGGAAEQGVQLTAVQKAILLGMGLQRKTIDSISTELNLPVSQLLALFIRIMRKICDVYKKIRTSAVQKEVKKEVVEQQQHQQHQQTSDHVPAGKRELDDEEAWDPTEQSLDNDLHEGELESKQMLRDRQRDLIQSLDLSQYAITSNEDNWSQALTGGKELKKKASGVISIKNPASTKLTLKRKHQSMDEVVAEGQKWAEKNKLGGGKKKSKSKGKK